MIEPIRQHEIRALLRAGRPLAEICSVTGAALDVVRRIAAGLDFERRQPAVRRRWASTGAAAGHEDRGGSR